MIDKITYKNGKKYSREAHQKALEVLEQGRVISARRRKAELTVAKISKNLRYYSEGGGKEVFNQAIPVKVALKYGYNEDERHPTWKTLVRYALSEKAVMNCSASAARLLLRLEKWDYKSKMKAKYERKAAALNKKHNN